MENDEIKPAELGIERLLWVFATLSVLLLIVLAVAPMRGYFSEWRAAQRNYNTLAAKADRIPIAMKQIWRPAVDVTDRCGSCHLAMDGAASLAGQKLYAAHPAIAHDPREFGCTVCHGGQGRATTARGAHGVVPHWNDPMLERGYYEAGCGTCHSNLRLGASKLVEQGRALVQSSKCGDCHHAGGNAPDLTIAGLHGFRADWHAKHVEKSSAAKDGPWTTSFAPLADDEVAAVSEFLRSQVGAPRLMAAKALAHQRGCRGCHRIGGVGGDDGPDLSDEGRRLVSDLDFSHVPGPRSLPSWLKQHFLNPPGVVPASQMPNLGFTDGEADQLTLYMLSLRLRTIPEAIAPRDRVRGLRLGERDFATDGESLFGVFCAACHGPRGAGRKFATLASTFPAIGEPEFLALADDAFLRRTLMEGRPGRRMPAWGKKDGGLRAEEVDAVVGYLRSLEPAAPTLEQVMAAPVDAKLGATLFSKECAPCHGASGEGSMIAPPLAAADNPATHEDSRIYGTVTIGVAGTAMGSFRRFGAGELRGLIAFVRSLPAVEVKRSGWAPRTGDAARGSATYGRACAKCHGDRGEGKEGPALSNAAFLAAATDGYLTATIIRGRGTTAMPHFGAEAPDHPRLAPAEVADVVSHLRSYSAK